MAHPAHDRTLLLDLRGVQPAGDRLIEIVRASGSLPYDSIAIDWDRWFPWSVDRDANSRWTMADHLVAAVDETIASGGRRSVLRLRDVVPAGYTSRTSYRHLLRARLGRGSQWRAALRKLIDDLIDDAVGLMPGLAAVELVSEGSGSGDELLRLAVHDRGLDFRRVEADVRDAVDDVGGTADVGGAPASLSGIEERLVTMAHPAAQPGIEEAHGRVRRWRSDMWLGIASLHEQLVRASQERSEQGDRLVVPMRRLATELRAAAMIEDELTTAYRNLAAPGAPSRFTRAITAPLREQYGQLAARVSSLRSLR